MHKRYEHRYKLRIESCQRKKHRQNEYDYGDALKQQQKMALENNPKSNHSDPFFFSFCSSRVYSCATPLMPSTIKLFFSRHSLGREREREGERITTTMTITGGEGEVLKRVRFRRNRANRRERNKEMREMRGRKGEGGGGRGRCKPGKLTRRI